MPGEPGPQVIGAGHDQGHGLDPLGAGAALGDHQRCQPGVSASWLVLFVIASLNAGPVLS